MLFNSIEFASFFITFSILYWFVLNKNLKLQNLLLLVTSYSFYAYTDWRFLALLIIVSLFNFFLGIIIEKNETKKSLFVFIGVLQGVGMLLYFKYFNFFIDSINKTFSSLGFGFSLNTLKIIVPLGISYFTFKTISYVIDIGNGKQKANKNWLIYFNYVAFFPTILSGPIDNGRSFIPQLNNHRLLDYEKLTDGIRQISWGLLKKVVIADNIAILINPIIDDYSTVSSSSLLLAVVLYPIQMYADFSGYSDMAIGFSRMIGFNVTKNFDYPFFSRNIAEFWRKWHISLTSWLTEYVFTPLSLAFRYYGRLGIILSVIINLTVVGLWHGGNWTYVVFGITNGLFFIPLVLNGTMLKRSKYEKGRFFPKGREFLEIMYTYFFIVFTFIIFRSPNIFEAFDIIKSIFSKSIIDLPDLSFEPNARLIICLSLIFMAIEWMTKEYNYALERIAQIKNNLFRWGIYWVLIFTVICLGVFEQSQFIYFQF